MDRQFVRRLLIDEAFAYGFTIAFWGSGLLLVKTYGLLNLGGILAYAGGAITGFGLLAVATFGSPVETVETDTSPEFLVLGAIHYLAAFVPIVLTHYLLLAPFGRVVTLALVGANVSVSYNAAAALEEVVSERLQQAEQ